MYFFFFSTQLRESPSSEIGCIHGISPVNSATTSKLSKTFRVCRVFCANHFCIRNVGHQNLFSWRNGPNTINAYEVILQEQKSYFSRKISANSLLFSQIRKPIIDSDSP